MKKFFLTTPIYYPNARPHVGSAYTTIVCDVLARYKRMCGYDVAFLTGTDEHGEKLERAAVAAGLSPRDFVAEKRKLFVQLWEKLGMPVKVYPQSDPTSLRFIYTDHPDHVTSVQRLLIRARENGYIYTHRYEGRYCISDERYVSDNTDPVNCDICGRPAELISEDNYFFKLSAFEKPLLELYETHPDFVKPDYRMNEVKSFVKSGLRDISVSRSRLKWGIPWPDDPHQVFYVWYDALTSYMTGIGYAQGENGSPEFQKYWRNKPGESEIVHMIGKDILRFHAVYWPAFIMAAYPNQPEMLPTTVFAHGWIYYEQDKMSKSKGNVVYPEPIVDALDSFGAPGNDALRYYLLREAPFGQDTSFSYEALLQRYNSDLANGLGNLASRTINMLNQFCAGIVSEPSVATQNRVTGNARAIVRNCLAAFDRFDFSSALSEVWSYISLANRLIVEKKPWELAKSSSPSDQESLQETLYEVSQHLHTLCVVLYPVMPATSERLWKQLGQSGDIRDVRAKDSDGNPVAQAIAPRTRVGKPEAIFPRLDKEKTLAKLDELSELDRERSKPIVGALREAPLQPNQLRANLAEAGGHRDKPKEALKSVENDKSQESGVTSQESGQATPPESPAPSPQHPAPSPAAAAESPKISIEDFAKVEMRTGEIKTAEAIPGAKKLLKLTVDIGTEVRQVCAGIAEFYTPEKLIGMKVVVVTNLQPRKLRGVESNGMIVAASIGDEGRPVLATFAEDVPNGARLR
ncbi:MAG: methionine--tRNA ligase [Terriglobia bacterium]|jgi:methionyl-tRNA synthetase